MWTTRSRARGGAALAGAALLVALAGCSSTGGAQEDEGAAGGGGGGGPQAGITVAMVTHGPAGDTFWDTIRRGAEDAAGHTGVELQYSSDGDVTAQASLIQNAIDQEVDAIAVSVPNADALGASIGAAEEAGIPVVMFNAGFDDWSDLGALMYFGQDESIAGQAAGERLAEEGATNVVCVIQAQGQSQLEARCDGVSQGLGAEVTRLYVEGTDLTSTTSTMASSLQQDPTISHVVTLGAPFALAAVQARDETGSSAAVATFDTNPDLLEAVQAGDVAFAIDQQPYAQGYQAVSSLALFSTTGTTLGGGLPVLTGPAFIDETNAEAAIGYAEELAG